VRLESETVNKINNAPLEGIWEQLLDTSGLKHASLQYALKTNLAKAILDGQIPEGTRLPSTRLLASALKIARITVALANETLTTQGLLIAHRRRGHFVAQDVRDKHRSNGDQTPHLYINASWSYLELSPKGQQWLETSESVQELPYSFSSGKIDDTLLPLADWHECERAEQATDHSEQRIVDAADIDDLFLVEQICNRVLPRRGIKASPGEVLITTGTQMSLYLLAELLITPGSVAAIEEPGYMGARNVFLRRGANIVPILGDRNGAIPPTALAKHSRIYVTPGRQCPTGVVLSEDRRRAFLNLAQNSQSLVIEDDYEAETQFNGKVPPALKSIDHSGHVIYLGSFSNSIATDLHIGFIVGHQKLIHRARQFRRLITLLSPGHSQRALALFLADGRQERSLIQQRASLEIRATQLTRSLQRHLPTWQFRQPVGGSSLWVQAPTTTNMKSIRDRARKKGVLIESTVPFYHSAAPPSHFIRLKYSSIVPEKIDAGIRLLAQAVSEKP
jgi:GntR family transcriptional regulator/MocR family aminotransferase